AHGVFLLLPPNSPIVITTRGKLQFQLKQDNNTPTGWARKDPRETQAKHGAEADPDLIIESGKPCTCVFNAQTIPSGSPLENGSEHEAEAHPDLIIDSGESVT
ncbi:MAG: hypothetical protein WHX93_18335, partial [bacterium]